MKTVFIFDLDGTLINSEHRTPRDENGRLILSEWLRLATWNNIEKDTLLPLVQIFRRLKREGVPVMFCTARTLTSDDRRFFAKHALGCAHILSRPEGDTRPDGQMKREMLQDFFLTRWKHHKKIMWDDNPEVRQEVSKIGIIACDAVTSNNHLEANSVNG